MLHKLIRANKCNVHLQKTYNAENILLFDEKIYVVENNTMW